MDYDARHSQEGGAKSVPSDARKKMIESAATLLAMCGLQGTAFTDVVERSGAPRGSIYHHFPEGKDQLVDEAMELAGERALHALDALRGIVTKGRDRRVHRPLARGPRALRLASRLRGPRGHGRSRLARPAGACRTRSSGRGAVGSPSCSSMAGWSQLRLIGSQ